MNTVSGFKIGDRVRVKPHQVFISLVRGAVITPPREITTPGHPHGIILTFVDINPDPNASPAVEVEVAGGIDLVPLDALELISPTPTYPAGRTRPANINHRSIAVYRDLAHAQTEIDAMHRPDGTRITTVRIPDDPTADADGNVIVIEVDGDKYVRFDGHIR